MLAVLGLVEGQRAAFQIDIRSSQGEQLTLPSAADSPPWLSGLSDRAYRVIIAPLLLAYSYSEAMTQHGQPALHRRT